MEFTTRQLFRVIRSGAKRLRTNNEHADGQKFWSNIKVLLEAFDNIHLEWKKIDNDFYNQVMKLPEFNKEGKTIELNHFVIQCVRIPKTEKLNIRKLMQIALNIGQLLPNIHKLPKEIVERFVDLQMFRMQSYIGDTSVFDKVITQDLIDKVINITQQSS